MSSPLRSHVTSPCRQQAPRNSERGWTGEPEPFRAGRMPRLARDWKALATGFGNGRALKSVHTQVLSIQKKQGFKKHPSYKAARDQACISERPLPRPSPTEQQNKGDKMLAFCFAINTPSTPGRAAGREGNWPRGSFPGQAAWVREGSGPAQGGRSGTWHRELELPGLLLATATHEG